MSAQYFYDMPGGRWSTSRCIQGRSISLIQDSHLNDPEDAIIILTALRLPTNRATLDEYFPERGQLGRCPTLQLLELSRSLNDRDSFIPGQKESGV